MTYNYNIYYCALILLLLLSRSKRSERITHTTEEKRDHNKRKRKVRPNNRIIHGRVLGRGTAAQRNDIDVIARSKPRPRSPSKRAQTDVRHHTLEFVEPREVIIRRPRNEMERPRLSAVRMPRQHHIDRALP